MIDWSRVCQLNEEVGAEDFEEVVELFLEEVEAVITRLGTQQDRATLGDDLHFLKGSAMSLGFDQFSQHCHDGETAAQNGLADSVDVGAILRCYELSKKIFLAEYDQRLAA